MDSQTNIRNLEAQIDETKKVLKNNCNKIVERDERLALLEKRTETLSMDANIFRSKSNKLKNQMWIKSKIPYFIGIFIILVIIIIVILENKK